MDKKERKLPVFRSPDKSVYWKIIFLKFLNQNIFCGYSKEPSQSGGSFEHPKHMFKLMGKEINTILGSQTILIWTYAHLQRIARILKLCMVLSLSKLESIYKGTDQTAPLLFACQQSQACFARVK